ncbi:MAG: hypothetical protein KAU20_04280 [Nanoarchaeota archaeon]|nr:hypothetical protein [Nanoarchaeota archaeon]
MANEDLALLNKSNVAIEFFRSHRDKITKDFNNQFVAIKEEEIVSSGENMGVLGKKLAKKGEDTSNLFIRFVSKDIFIL